LAEQIPVVAAVVVASRIAVETKNGCAELYRGKSLYHIEILLWVAHHGNQTAEDHGH
jgi:hypothetical protein